MVLSGEGADEVFAGYLYFHKAPDAEELHKETVNKVTRYFLIKRFFTFRLISMNPV